MFGDKASEVLVSKSSNTDEGKQLTVIRVHLHILLFIKFRGKEGKYNVRCLKMYQTQIERHENAILKQENDKLRAENSVMKDAIANPTCNTCGGPSIPGHLSFEEHHLRIENARLREELHRLYTVTNKFLGWPVSSPFGNQGSSPSSDSCLELSVGRSGIGRSSTVSDSMGLGNGHFGAGPAMPISKPEIGVSGNDIPLDRTIYVDFALAAMNELVEMAQTDAPLWIRSRDGGSRETLNLDEYSRTFPSSAGMKHINWTTEATRDSTMVIINSLALVETLMDAVCIFAFL